ncbi:MAG: hypothetical protein M9945_14395 [Aquamicrobium sp.]|uniref:hypothetical protein n=1 Tax=Aquamicrobium sp. TaxID=1872579 RepID=UPI00349EA63D|nr:hypothetical protein [Aquamicrobium sp.]
MVLLFAEPDYKNYDWKKEQAREKAHQAQLKDWLLRSGYAGQHTGKILSLPMGDGAARYMYADSPKKSFLVHLPYGDAWDSPLARDLPKAAVIKRLVDEEKVSSLFDKMAAKNDA